MCACVCVRVCVRVCVCFNVRMKCTCVGLGWVGIWIRIPEESIGWYDTRTLLYHGKNSNQRNSNSGGRWRTPTE